jgi:uncharacterized protein YggE
MRTARASSTAVLSAILLALSPGPMLAEQSAPNTISVSGDAEVRVVPDEVILTLGVETFDRILKTAKAANDDSIRRTIAVTRGHGVAAEQIQTDYLGIAPKYRSSDIALDLQGYVVRKTVVIRLRDISRFEAVLTDALDAGVTHVHGVDFRSSDLRRHRDQARAMAMKAAREKADLLAKESGRAIGTVQSIGEASYGYWSSYGSWWGSRYGQAMQNAVQNFGGATMETDATLAPGQISIKASVHTVFALQ